MEIFRLDPNVQNQMGHPLEMLTLLVHWNALPERVMLDAFKVICTTPSRRYPDIRGGSRFSEEGVKMWKMGVRLPNFTQNLLKFPMKMK